MITSNSLPRAQRNHDRAEPRCTADYFRADELNDFLTTTTAPSPVVSDNDIELFIGRLAANGFYFDEFDRLVHPQPVYVAVARQWLKDKEAVGGIIGPDFWAWARALTRMGAV